MGGKKSLKMKVKKGYFREIKYKIICHQYIHIKENTKEFILEKKWSDYTSKIYEETGSTQTIKMWVNLSSYWMYEITIITSYRT